MKGIILQIFLKQSTTCFSVVKSILADEIEPLDELCYNEFYK